MLLMHAGALDAEMLPQLIELYKKRGFKFVTLEEAEKDPAYAKDVHPGVPEPGPAYPVSHIGPVPVKPEPDVDLNEICK